MVSTQPINIHVGRGDVWANVTVPNAGLTVPLNSNGEPGSGDFVGSTLDLANFIYRPTVFDIRTQQSTGVVGYVITEEELRLEFVVGEFTYVNLKNFIIGMKDQASFVSVGGRIIPPVSSVLLVAPRRGGGFIEAMIYAAVFAEDREMQFNRAGQLAMRVVARAQIAADRALGDQLGFVAPVIVGT